MKSYNNKKLMDTSSASLITPKIYLIARRKLHYFFFSSSDPIFLKMEQINRSIWVDIKRRNKSCIKNHDV